MPFLSNKKIEVLKQDIHSQIASNEKKTLSLIQGMQRATQSYRESQKQWGKQINAEDCLNVYRKETLVFKGINKKSRNLFRKWCEADSPIDGETIPDNILDKVKEFDKKSKIVSKFITDYKNMCIFKDSFIELATIENIEPNGVGLEKPIGKGLENIYNIDPRSMERYTVKNEEAKKINNIQTPIEDVEYYIQKQGRGKPRLLIHPSRIIHNTEFTLADGDFGVTCPIEVAYRVATSKYNADWALGEILWRFGKPFPVVNIDKGSSKEIEEVFSALGKLSPKSGFVGDERYHFGILTPSGVVQPAEFMESFYIGLAAALEMPLMMLIGVQKGQLTGSEQDRADYYEDLMCIRENLYTPALNRIYSQLLGSWDYQIYWNPDYVDEKSESEIRKNNAETLKILYFDMGIIDDVTARQMARELDINVPEEEKLPVEEEPLEEEPEIQPELPFAKTRNVEIRKPTKEELAIAEKQRELGRRILEEQDKL